MILRRDRRVTVVAVNFDPDQPRDERGRWSRVGTAPPTSTADQAPRADTGPPPRSLTHPEFVLGLGRNEAEVKDYVAREGKEYKPAPLPKGVRRGTMKECYRNATMLVLADRSLRYAEGFAQTGGLPGLTFAHAWAVKPDGTVVDNTWDEPERCRYFGVTYDTDKYLSHISETGMYGVAGDKSKEFKGRDLR